jgi:hypothetical protein
VFWLSFLGVSSGMRWDGLSLLLALMISLISVEIVLIDNKKECFIYFVVLLGACG